MRQSTEITKTSFHMCMIYDHGPVALRLFYDKLSVRLQDVLFNPDVFVDPNINYEWFNSIVVDTKSKYLSPKSVRFKIYI